MRVLITGSAGFIGSNLARSLLDDGATVVGFDNLSQGDLLNMDAFHSHPKFTFVKADVMDRKALIDAAKDCDIIYHLAAFKIPRFGNAYETLNINAQGTQNAVDAAIAVGAHLVFSSTSDVYGKNPNIPFSEDHDLVLGPPNVRRWAYAVSKAYDEQMLFAEGERRNLRFTIVRFFGGYGPAQNLTWWGGPQSVFINQALDDQVLTIHGDGQQTRSFTFVEDHVQGLRQVLNCPEALGQVFNLGNDREITIQNLAEMIWKIIRPDTKPKIEHIPYSTFGKYQDVMRRVPDLTKSKKMLGYQPKIQLEEGLPITIEWQMRRRKIVKERKEE